MRNFILSSIMILSLLPVFAAAGGREDFDSFTRDLTRLDGRFAEEVFDTNGTRKESSTGQVALSAPRLFRWEYVEPYPKLIVADGNQVWAVVSAARQFHVGSDSRVAGVWRPSSGPSITVTVAD